jgi:hypothetical protein
LLVSGAVQRSDPMYALPAKAAIFRSARRFLPALAAIPNSGERTLKEVRHDVQVGIWVEFALILRSGERQH